jgi:hypothetical protein
MLNLYSIKMSTVYYIFIYLPSERIYFVKLPNLLNLLRINCDNFEYI